MEFQRTKNSARILIYGIVEKITLIVLPFVLRTLIIKQMGIEYSGLSSLFTSVLSILSVAELGIGSAITFCLYKPVALDDIVAIKALLNLLRKIYKVIGLIILTIGFLLLPLLPFFINGNYPPNINIYIIFVIYIFDAATSYLGFEYKSVLFQAYQKGDVVHRIQTIVELTKFLLQFISIVFFKNYYLVVLCLLLSIALKTLMVGFLSKKYFPELRPEGTVNLETKGIIKKKVLSLSLHSIISKLVNSADNIIISSFGGLVFVGLYGNYHYIENAILGFMLVLFGSIRSPIGNYLYTKNSNENIFMFKVIRFGVSWVTIACSTCLLCLYQPFMRIWMGEGNMLSFSVVVFISLTFYCNSNSQFFSSCYISTAGLWNKTLIPKIIASVLNLILDIVFVKSLDVFGIVLATCICYAFILYPLDVIVVYKYVFKKTISAALIDILLNAVMFLAFAILTFLIAQTIDGTGFVSFLKKAAICIIIPNTVFLTVFSSTKECKSLAKHFKLLFLRGKANAK